VLMDLHLTGRDSLLLFVLFAVQFFIPALRVEITLAYLLFAVVLLIANRAQIRYYVPSRGSRAPST
jgi:hypothetical protein